MSDTTLVPAATLHGWTSAALREAGMPAQHAGWTADAMVWADLHGLPAHGVGGKLKQCLARIAAGGTAVPDDFPVLAETAATLAVDAQDGWGQAVGTFAMQQAISKARDIGVGLASVRNATSAAAMGYFATLAAEAGCIGLAVTNGPALIAAPGGTRRVVGNQGHALACPAADAGMILYDTATTTMSTGQMDLIHERGGQLPEGVLRDFEGRPTTDPSLWTTGLLEPIGGHRGFGLSVALEVLTGLLAGSRVHAPEVGYPTTHGETQGVSLFFLVVAPGAAGGTLEELEARAAAFVSLICDSGPEARAPGQRAVATARERREAGVPVSAETMARLAPFSGMA